jgi:hypothetical protein
MWLPNRGYMLFLFGINDVSLAVAKFSRKIKLFGELAEPG